MDLSDGLETPSFTKILVEPIGGISESIFSKYVNIIQTQFKTLRVNSLTRFMKENQNSPFQNLNWKSAKMNLTFIVNHGDPIAPPKRDQNISQRLHAYIGITGGVGINLKQVYSEYEQRLKQFPFIKNARLFAVDYQIQDDDLNNLKDLIILLSTVDSSKTQAYVERAMSDIANCILRTFEKSVTHVDKIGTSALDVSSMKKFGDFALLAGDVPDAIEMYRRIIKVNLKDKTLAQSRENLITCYYISEHKQQFRDETYRAKLVKLFAEVTDFFEKKRIYSYPYLVQCLVKETLFFMEYLEEDDDSRTRVQTNLTRILETASRNVKSTTHRRHVLEKCAEIYTMLKYRRKTGFVRLKLAKLYYKDDDYDNAVANVVMAFDAYNIPIDIRSETDWLIQDSLIGRGWPELQLIVLKDLTFYSTRNVLFRCRVMLYLLSNYHTTLDKREQTWLFGELDRIFSEKNKNRPARKMKICLTKFPIFLKVKALRTCDPPTKYIPKSQLDDEDDPKNVFLFIPKQFQRKKENLKTTWVVNEPVEVELYLYNPFKLDINLKTVQLKVNLECVIYATGGVIKSQQIVRMKLYLVPKVQGMLCIESVTFQVNKIDNKIEVAVEEHLREEIEVIENIPKCVCRFAIPTVTIYEGEELENRLIVQNIGNAPIERLELEIANPVEEENVISYDAELIPKNLPLGPKESMAVPLRIFIRERTNKERSLKERVFEFCVTYGTHKWSRVRNVRLKIKCSKSLKVISANLDAEGTNVCTKIANVSNKNFVVYLKNGEVVNVPPNYTKEIPQNLQEFFCMSPNNLRIDFGGKQ